MSHGPPAATAAFQAPRAAGLTIRAIAAAPGRVHSLLWCCASPALALDVGQALGELAISDPDNIHATYVPVPPVVAPAHDGAS